jgi:hypothetical protein
MYFHFPALAFRLLLRNLCIMISNIFSSSLIGRSHHGYCVRLREIDFGAAPSPRDDDLFPRKSFLPAARARSIHV